MRHRKPIHTDYFVVLSFKPKVTFNANDLFVFLLLSYYSVHRGSHERSATDSDSDWIPNAGPTQFIGADDNRCARVRRRERRAS